MQKESRVRLHPVRMASYLLFFLADILLFAFFRSFFFLLIAVMMVVCTAVSVTGMNRIAENLRLEAGADQTKVICGETVLIQLKLLNGERFLSMNASMVLQLSNCFFETGSDLKVSMPVKAREESSLLLPVKLVDIGRFQVSCNEVRIPDLLGIVSVFVPAAVRLQIDVLPAADQEQELEISGYLSGVSETEESRSKGSDYAEVSDIREYVPGDRIRDIHWKLSAKQDTLMVKERISMAGSEIMILAKLSSDKNRTKRLLAYCSGMMQAFISQRVPVCLLCWNQESFEFERYSCDSMAELAGVFGGIYAVPVKKRLQEQQETYMKNCFPYLGSYLLAQEQNGDIQVVIKENV